MRDFTFVIYRILLDAFLKQNYIFLPYAEYLSRLDRRFIILRHDVDKSPRLSLQMAKFEKELNIRGTYFFRIKRGRAPTSEIKSVSNLGHEIGYHYEDFYFCKGDIEAAMISFQKNLQLLRRITPVETVCMHGNPMSKHDNREMWKNKSYREFGIIGEPYFDVDFNNVMYLTDTGRRWDGEGVSIRDKVGGDRLGVRGEDKNKITNKWPRLHSTQDIINALRNDEMPDQIMLTIHPQRWTDEWGPWVWELVSQKIKNVVKYFIVKYRGNKVRGEG